MNVETYTDAKAFYDEVLAFLSANEAHNNLVLGILGIVVDHPEIYENPYLGLVRDGGQVILVSIRTPPHHQIISWGKDPEAVRLIAKNLYDSHLDFPSAVGPKELVNAFAQAWTEMSGQNHQVKINERIYRVENLLPVREVGGHAREVAPSDRGLLNEWMDAFMREALGEVPEIGTHDSMIEQAFNPQHPRRLMLWIDGNGQPVSLAGCNGPTPNGIRIGPVYTPPEFRGKGYGSAVTHALTQANLDGGRTFCFLFTDLANPTSNSIYQKMGYEPVCDVDMIEFGE